MKKVIFVLVLLVTLMSCERGVTNVTLNGNENSLPQELKGLKVYNVSLGTLSDIKVAVLNGQVNSVTYPVGKTRQTTIIVKSENGNIRMIEYKEIISETDEVIVIRKR